jgi:sterol desaturase/sphingolipid hydroxylase (fatty acid hydroxylase superfamily)
MVLLARSSLPARDLVALFACGYLAWTVAEYAVHRFVLHGLAPTEHLRHHAAPKEPVVHVFWQIWAALAVVYAILGGAFLSGVLVAYAWYLFAHYSAHHNPKPLAKTLAKHHLGHHRLATRNFGVSTTLWDRVFGTMSR